MTSAVELTAAALASLAGDQVAKGVGIVASRTTGRSQAQVGELVASLSIEELREVVSAAADRHEDVERSVRLIAARASPARNQASRPVQPRCPQAFRERPGAQTGRRSLPLHASS